MKILNESENETSISDAELKFEGSFECEGKMYYVMFSIINIIKNFRNALIKKCNDYYYPKLTLSTKYFLETGMCSVK